MNKIEKIRDQWQRGELSLGTAVSLTDAAVSELFGEAGYDFVWIDCEHSAISLSQALDHIRAARGAGAAAFLRVPSNDPVVMKPYLELHPAAIIVPRIESIHDAKRAVASFHYPPQGVRGFGPARGVRFGAVAPPQYLAQIDRQVLLILQIEHIQAVDEIDAILDIPGLGRPGRQHRGRPGRPERQHGTWRPGRASRRYRRLREDLPGSHPEGDPRRPFHRLRPAGHPALAGPGAFLDRGGRRLDHPLPACRRGCPADSRDPQCLEPRRPPRLKNLPDLQPSKAAFSLPTPATR